MHKSPGGFTLIELLLSLAIIGVIAGIVIAAINPDAQLVAANDARRRAMTRELQNAIMQHVIDLGYLPGDRDIPTSSASAIPICRLGVTDPTCINLDALVTRNFIVNLPVDTSETDSDVTGYSVYLNESFVRVTADHLGRKGSDGSSTPGGTSLLTMRLGSTSGDGAGPVATAPNGNQIIAGTVWSTADLSGDGDTNDAAESGTGYGGNDAFFAVFDSDNNFLFAKRLGGTGSDSAGGVAVDSNGNIAFIMYATGAADVNGDGDRTDGGAESNTGYGSTDAVLTVFDSNGNWLFAKRLGGTGADYGSKVVFGASNSIIVNGQITGDADLNGDGDRTDGGAESSTGYGGTDGFISVFSSTGTFQFAKRIGGTSTDSVVRVAVDSNNRLILGGAVTGNADLNGDGDNTDGGAESSTGYGGNDTFVSVFDSNGNWLFAKRLGGTSTDYANGVAVDSSDNIFLAGMVTGAGDMNGDGDRTDGGAESNTGYGSGDIYVSVFDSNGNWLFAKRLGGTSSDYANTITTDSQGNFYVGGQATGDADMNGDGDRTDGGAESSTGYGGGDSFVAAFDNSGVFQYAKRIGGTGTDYVIGLGIDGSQNLVVSSTVTGAADLNGDGDATDGVPEIGTGYGGLDIGISVFSEL